MNDTPHIQAFEATSVVCTGDPLPQADASEALPPSASADPCGSTDGVEEMAGAAMEDMELPADSRTDSDPDCEAASSEDPTDGLDRLRGELSALRAELAEERARQTRISREFEEFRTLYPDTPLSDCSDAVWRAVESGTPLAAAYALEARKQAILAARAMAANAQNAERSAGGIKDNPNEFFTPEEVRAMSQSEVRASLSRIMQSMKRW